MPSSSSGQNNYYASRHRRPSQHLQSGPTDQIDAQINQSQSPTKALAYLPATTYSQPTSHKTRKLSGTSAIPVRTGFTQNSAKDATDEDSDPHEFYRQHQTSTSNKRAGSLRQGSILSEGLESGISTDPRNRGASFSSSFSHVDGAQDLYASVKAKHAPLHADQQFIPPALYQATKSTPVLSGPTRSRKSSIRELVAKFDTSSSNDIPPLPSHSRSRATSRTVSPIILTSHQQLSTRGFRSDDDASFGNEIEDSQFSAYSNGSLQHAPRTLELQGEPNVPYNSAASQSMTNLDISNSPHRPLFGEVMPVMAGALKAGYGIQNARRRRGSEGSPMHSPNPMFPAGAAVTGSPFSQKLPNAWQDEKPVGSEMVDINRTPINIPVQHRRANSDLTASRDGVFARQYAFQTPTRRNPSDEKPTDSNASEYKRNSQSRIPISSHRYSHTSDSGRSSPSSRAASTIGRHSIGKAVPWSGASSIPTPLAKQSNPKRTPRSPTRIKSPGGRANGPPYPQTEKSPSLRANIIVPPPKISPPLRSSRPRQTVSAATTSASRAKMAEKFTSMQKQHNERRSSTRKPQRPPELNDIDLGARRLKITQALTRSRQGQELRGEYSGQWQENGSPTGELSLASPDDFNMTDAGSNNPMELSVPAVVIGPIATEEDGENEDFHTPVDEFGRQAQSLQIHISNSTTEEMRASPFDVDSPTLGHTGRRYNQFPSLLQTNFPGIEGDSETCSAVTAETDGTNIDIEPQSEFTRPRSPGQTVLSQIMRMRRSSPGSARSFSSSHTDEVADDHAEEESIHIILQTAPVLEDHLTQAPVAKLTQQRELDSDGFGASNHDRSSWTSSIQDDFSEEDIQRANVAEPGVQTTHEPGTSNYRAHSVPAWSFDQVVDESMSESVRTTMASDAYTIVNFVLQQHSNSGMVDEDIVDNIYRRVMSQSPRLTQRGTLDAQKVEQLCLKELQNYDVPRQSHVDESSWNQHDHSKDLYGNVSNSVRPEPADLDETEEISVLSDDHVDPPSWSRPSHFTHRPKASLDSAEDWAETSPSVGSWMQFAASPGERRGLPPSALATSNEADPDETLMPRTFDDNELYEMPRIDERSRRDDLSKSPPRVELSVPRPPSKSPPPPPLQALSMSQVAGDLARSEMNATQPPSGMFLSTTSPPMIPNRVTSVPLSATQPPLHQAASIQTSTDSDPTSESRPSLEHEQMNSADNKLSPTPEQRKLKQRRHVLKELVDTEARFEKDMKVLCDIYKETAHPTLSYEDIKIIFGNSEQVLQFGTDFLGLLKRAAKPAYVIDRSERYQHMKRHEHGFYGEAEVVPKSSSTSDLNSLQNLDLTDSEKDRLTWIGEAFDVSLDDMGSIYGEYLKNRDAANKKLQSMQRVFGVRQWLDECKKGSADLTAAWDLDSLMVKPVQRIMKYPLLIGQLIEATPEDHPDIERLRSALRRLTEINTSINDAKKQAELVDQALNRKRKESDVRNGLSKALGRRTEKLRQHVGISDTFDDREYNKLKHEYLENMTHLVLAGQDIQIYRTALTAWVSRMCDIGAAADAWCDVSQTQHTQAESKLRQFAMLVRRISTIALPDHLSEVQKKVSDPMDRGFKMLESLSADPKGLLQKRDKRLIDYARFKNMKDRGEKLDKKTIERIEQWEALNAEAKIRMRKLLTLTGTLVRTCRESFVRIHLSWLEMSNRKFSAAMAIRLDEIFDLDIEKEWQVDFDYQHASALNLSICNGSLLADAVNMVNFFTPSSTLNGEDSPRPSWNGPNKRSISLNSDGSPALGVEFTTRNSGSFVINHMDENIGDPVQPPFVNGRLRAASAASFRDPRTPDLSARTTSLATRTNASGHSARPGTSPARSTEPSPRLPRLSIDAPSPSIGPLRPDSPLARPDSTSTFFSAAGAPTQALPTPPIARASAIFSSAMPMSDSPMSSYPSPFAGEDRNHRVLFTAASVYEFNIDRSRREAGFPYLTYVAGEIFDVVAERGELWLARNQDDPQKQIGWIWNKHFAKLAE